MHLVMTAALTGLLSVLSSFAHAGDPCLPCHEKETPGIVRYWKESAHARKEVGCTACHTDNIEANHKRSLTVDATICGSCHKAAFQDHTRSKHGIGLKTGQGCTRNQPESDARNKSCGLCHKAGSSDPFVTVSCAMFLAQSPEMQRQGCGACHLVENRCDSCHTRHGTDLRSAGDPGTCGTCHMGPDHPQLEAWETSRHGVLFRKNGFPAAPSCVTCHMPGGTHDVSRGVSAGVPKDQGERKKKEREGMIALCSSCHTRAFAARNLADADGIAEQSNALVAEAKSIVDGLQKDGLLAPRPAERPQHPLLGKSVETGPHMLYEDLSLAESLFFKARTFHAATAFKGAYHQNPDYAHWFGNAPLKLTLSEIRSEAARLRHADRLKKRLDNLGVRDAGEQGAFAELKKKLRELNEQHLTGKITEQEHRERKNRILDDYGLK